MRDACPDDSLPTLVTAGDEHDTNRPRPDTTRTGVPAPVSAGDEPFPSIPGYEVLGLLGKGGMGVVYLARQTALGRLVALKVLRTTTRGPEDEERFRREAELAARLAHPQVVQVFDFGTFADSTHGTRRSYITFEYVAGAGLDRLLARSVLPPRQAAALVARLARTMQHVHERGVVHRDLKPANVLLQMEEEDSAPEGEVTERLEVQQVSKEAKPFAVVTAPLSAPLVATSGPLHETPLLPKITDFGLARHAEDDLALTRVGQLLGTPGYMAPEQVDGRRESVGPATDIHALGAILYECLTGRPPFKGASLHETLDQICKAEPIAIRKLRPQVPIDLETICLKCLRKRPAARYRSASDLADDLERFLEDRTILARRIGWVGRFGRWVARQPYFAGLSLLCLLLLVALVGAAAGYTYRVAVLRSIVHAAEVRAVTAREVAATHEYHSRLHAVRRRAERLELGWARAGIEDLRTAALLPTRVRDLHKLRTDATWCLSSTDLVATHTCPLGFPVARLAFHPTRPLVAVAQSKSWLDCAVALLDVSSGKVVRRLAFRPAPLWHNRRMVQGGITALAFSPDGRWLVAGERNGQLQRWDLNANPAIPEALPGHTAEVHDLLFSPSGDALFSAAADRRVLRWSTGSAWKVTHRMVASGWLALGLEDQLLVTDEQKVHALRLTDLQPTGPGWGIAARRISAVRTNGLAVSSGGSVHLVDPHSGRITRSICCSGQGDAHLARVDALCLAPDGMLLLSVSEPERVARVWDMHTGRLLHAFALPEGANRAAFSPDGTTIALAGGREVRFYRIERSSVVTPVALQPWPVQMAAFLQGGRELACLAGDRHTGQAAISMWSLQGKPAQRWSLPTCLPPTHLETRIASDQSGTWLAWTSARGVELAAARFQPDTQRHVVVRGVHALSFAPQGDLWLGAGNEVHSLDLDSMTLQRGWSNRLGDMLSGVGDQWAVVAGQQWIVAAGRDGVLRLLDPNSVRPLYTHTFSAGIRSVALAPDEKMAVIGTSEGEVLLVTLPHGQILTRLRPHAGPVEAVTFLGADRLASGSRDGQVCVWDRQGRFLHPWLTIEQPGPVAALSGTPRGDQLAVVLTGSRAVRLLGLDRLRDRLQELGLE